MTAPAPTPVPYKDLSWNDDGSFNREWYDADRARVPDRTEVGVGSTWEVALPKYPGVWKVTKVNPRSIDLVDGTGARLRVDVDLLRRTAFAFIEVEGVYRPRTGHLVTPVRDLGPRGPQVGVAYVVLKTIGHDAVQLAVVNGDGRYWPKIPISVLGPYEGTVGPII